MTFEELKAFCLSLPGSTTDLPFDDEIVVFRVSKRIFALCAFRGKPLKVNLKCDPALARDLRLAYPDVVPGWHMNKEHWNTVNCQGALERGFLEQMIRHSYDRICEGLPRAARNSLSN